MMIYRHKCLTICSHLIRVAGANVRLLHSDSSALCKLHPGTFISHKSYHKAQQCSWSRYLAQRRLYATGGSDSKAPQGDAATTAASTTPAPDVPKIDVARDVEPTTVVKVMPVFRTKPREKTDFSKSYTENVFITPARAMYEYCLTPSDLDNLPTSRRRSPYPESDDIIVYLRKDIERKAMTIWGNQENLERERRKQLYYRRAYHDKEIATDTRKPSKQYIEQHANKDEEQPFIFNPQEKKQESVFRTGPGKVVLYAVLINGVNVILKLGAWLYTGSHSMFAEFIHSVADTANQVILAIGLHQSQKKADLEHPYGWVNFRNVASLISGVGIFCLGSGLSVYHGIHGLLHPSDIESLSLAMSILTLSFVTEGATLAMALRQVMKEARKKNMSVVSYVNAGLDPSTNVVLLEDLAAVVGVGVAGSCMWLSYATGNHVPDAVGSLLVGGLLAGVAGFIIYTNTITLVGRSIPAEQKQLLMKELESDRLIRALHDVKATDMGSNTVRFKAEVDFDGREITRLYVDRLELEGIYKEMQNIESTEDVENFMLKHGENIIDTLGAEVDRIERNLKKKHPEIRHVDLEQL